MERSEIVAVENDSNKNKKQFSSVFPGTGRVLGGKSDKKKEANGPRPSGEFGDDLNWEDEQAIRRVLAENKHDDDSPFIHLDHHPSPSSERIPDDDRTPTGMFGGELTWEDEQAIRRILAENEHDDADFAASLSNLPLIPSDPGSSPEQPSTSRASSDEKRRPGMSLIDPEWETIDPNPDIYALFQQFNREFFWGKLTSVEVKWSKQMTSCAGICRYQSRAGYCSIGLSLPLLKLRPRKDMVETLLHEMIHAYLFVASNDRDRESHGPFFHEHMFRINKAAGTKITVYHSFHDEVAFYKTHVWRCDGVCRTQKPYFGFVKRARNREPSKNDLWWAEHQAKCGGKFVKISQPEGFVSRKRKAAQPDSSPASLSPSQPTLLKFPGFTSAEKLEEPTKYTELKVEAPSGKTSQRQQAVLDTSAFWRNKSPTGSRPVLFGLSNASEIWFLDRLSSIDDRLLSDI
ncbi:hypothetical protein RvY_16816-2 [Ramazzottius varieornatus]|uniref:SprT-like domain-containing protein n=1 Tax=Ramazzottius varieornatus TaxID=947166 RepID=A0A1D1W0W2_RAMVA|nr:hypothetical protein RvY_16816-2 [Ramazzottius varieornatus]